MKIVEISLLAFYKSSSLAAQLSELKNIGVKRIHYDVMDGIYVPNFTFCDQYINLLKSFGFQIEVHLMVQDVKYFYNIFKNHHVDAIVFHPSPIKINEIEEIMLDANKNDINIGLAINLDEDFNQYKNLFALSSINLIMGVNAGFGGQTISEIGINHLHNFKSFLLSNKLNIPIIFDGGVNDKTINLVYDASDYIVSGSYIMNSENKKVALKKLLTNNFLNKN